MLLCTYVHVNCNVQSNESYISFVPTTRLTSLIQTESNDMRVDHAQVKRSQEDIRISKSDEHGIIGHWITLVDLTSGLVSVSSVVTSDLEWGVRQVELTDPGNELGLTGAGGSDVGVVGANSLSGRLPGQVEELAGEGKRLRVVAGDTRGARVSWMLLGVDIDTALIRGDGRVAGVGNAVAGDLVRLGVVGREAVGVGLVVDEQGREILPT